jgi:hypothetical protein
MARFRGAGVQSIRGSPYLQLFTSITPQPPGPYFAAGLERFRLCSPVCCNCHVALQVIVCENAQNRMEESVRSIVRESALVSGAHLSKVCRSAQDVDTDQAAAAIPTCVLHEVHDGGKVALHGAGQTGLCASAASITSIKRFISEAVPLMKKKRWSSSENCCLS